SRGRDHPAPARPAGHQGVDDGGQHLADRGHRRVRRRRPGGDGRVEQRPGPGDPRGVAAARKVRPRTRPTSTRRRSAARHRVGSRDGRGANVFRAGNRAHCNRRYDVKSRHVGTSQATGGLHFLPTSGTPARLGPPRAIRGAAWAYPFGGAGGRLSLLLPLNPHPTESPVKIVLVHAPATSPVTIRNSRSVLTKAPVCLVNLAPRVQPFTSDTDWAVTLSFLFSVPDTWMLSVEVAPNRSE